MYLAGLKLKSPGEILLGIAGAVGSVLLSAVGETAKYVGGSALGFMDSVGKGMFKAAQGTVGGVEKAGKAGISLGKGYWRDTNSRNGLKNPLGYMAHHGNKFVENNTKYTPAHATWDPYKGLTEHSAQVHLSRKLKYGLLGAGLLEGFNHMSDEENVRNMGTMDTKATTATPDYTPPKYVTGRVDNAGATGDLVFALHKNRFG